MAQNLNYYKKNRFPSGFTDYRRDSEVWNHLKKLLAKNIHNKAHSVHSYTRKSVPLTYRVWSAGCSTGEEVISLDSLLRTAVKESQDNNIKVNHFIYASDIHAERLYRAQQLCDRNIKHIWRIRFKSHHLVDDDPIPYTNLIMCRNVLMYFKKKYQKIICDNLYKSLRRGGILVLGKSERLRGDAEFKLRPLSYGLRIFQKDGVL